MMKRYLKIIKSFFIGSIMNQLEYKANFFIGGIFELAWMLMYIVFINVIYLHTDTVNGFDKNQMLLLIFQGGLMDAFFSMIFVPGLSRLPELVNSGDLDFFLLKPINQRFIISFNDIDISQIKNIIIILAGIIYVTSNMYIEISFYLISLYVLLSINGFIIIYSILYALMSLSFWVIRMDVVMRIGSELISIGNKPMSIYPSIVQKILIFIIPILVCFNFPIMYLIGNLSYELVLFSFIISCVFWFFSQLIYHMGVKRYASASS